MKYKSLGIVFIVNVLLAACQYTLVPGEGDLSGDISFKVDHEKMGIIGGEVVSDRDPLNSHIVGVYENKEGQVCTGTLIGPQSVMTAAHCVGVDMFVVFDHQFRERSEVRRVTEFMIYPAYLVGKDDAEDTYDIAILKFEGVLPTGYAAAQMISFKVWTEIQKTSAQPFKVILAGYGFDHPEKQSGIGQLRKVEVFLSDFQFGIFSAMIDQQDSKGACEGDSGGPVFIQDQGQYYLWGVIGHALTPLEESENPCQYKSVVTQVLPFKEWIGSF